MSVDTDREARYLRLFRQSARAFLIAGQVGDAGRMRAEEKSMRAFYAELGLSAQYSADIFIVELSRGQEKAA